MMSRLTVLCCSLRLLSGQQLLSALVVARQPNMHERNLVRLHNNPDPVSTKCHSHACHGRVYARRTMLQMVEVRPASLTKETLLLHLANISHQHYPEQRSIDHTIVPRQCGCPARSHEPMHHLRESQHKQT